jgi:hypothetical protein
MIIYIELSVVCIGGIYCLGIFWVVITTFGCAKKIKTFRKFIFVPFDKDL